MFHREAKLYGRIINENGVKYDPRYMRNTEFGSDLQQFNLRHELDGSSIPDYARRVAPLHVLVETCYAIAPKRTKRAVKNISPVDQWNAEHGAAFSRIKEQIENAIILAHPKKSHAICLFSDAPDTHCAAILSQMLKDQTSKPVEEQDH